MKRKLSIILSLTLVIMLLSTAGVYGAKKVKSKSVSLSPKSMVLAVGDIAQLNATIKPSNSTDKLTWTSSDNAVVTVSSKGMAKGIASGNAVITVTTTSKKTATCDIEVKQYSTDTIEPTSIFSAIKDKIIALIKDTTYTKSEVDAKIAAVPSGSSGSTCNCPSEPKTKDEIVLNPNGSFDFKGAHLYRQTQRFTIHFSDMKITSLKVNSYDDWLNSEDKEDVWYKAELTIQYSGNVDSQYEGFTVNPSFSNNLDATGYFGKAVEKATIQSDGTFSGKVVIYLHNIPNKLTLSECSVDEDE